MRHIGTRSHKEYYTNSIVHCSSYPNVKTHFLRKLCLWQVIGEGLQEYDEPGAADTKHIQINPFQAGHSIEGDSTFLVIRRLSIAILHDGIT